MANGIKIWCEMVCDNCCSAPYGEFYRRYTIGTLRKQAKAMGWKVVQGKTLCPECQEKLKAEKSAKKD